MPRRKRRQRNHISNRQRVDAIASYAQYVKDGGPRRDLAKIKVIPQDQYKSNGVH